MALAMQTSRVANVFSQRRAGLPRSAPAAVPTFCRRYSSVVVRAESNDGRPSATKEQPPAIPGLKQDWASPDGAEARANLGANYQNLGQMQAFDGPAPETINGKYVSSAHYLLPPNMVDMYLLAHQSVCCLGSLPSMQLQ
eukprot:jgi/Chrzof1/11517/UNPLg00451.t1